MHNFRALLKFSIDQLQISRSPNKVLKQWVKTARRLQIVPLCVIHSQWLFQCSNDVLCTYMLTWLLKVLKEIFVLCKSAAHSQNAQESRCRNELECIWYHFPAYSKARVLSLQWKAIIYKIPFSAFCALCFPFFCTRSLAQRDTHTHVSRQRLCVFSSFCAFS
jgi:hypothetical protein